MYLHFCRRGVLLLSHPPASSQKDRPLHCSSTRALTDPMCFHMKPVSLNFILLLHNGCSAYCSIKLTPRWELKLKLCASAQKEPTTKLSARIYCKRLCCRKIAAAAPSILFLVQSHLDSCSSNLFKGIKWNYITIAICSHDSSCTFIFCS